MTRTVKHRAAAQWCSQLAHREEDLVDCHQSRAQAWKPWQAQNGESPAAQWYSGSARECQSVFPPCAASSQ